MSNVNLLNSQKGLDGCEISGQNERIRSLTELQSIHYTLKYQEGVIYDAIHLEVSIL